MVQETQTQRDEPDHAFLESVAEFFGRGAIAEDREVHDRLIELAEKMKEAKRWT